MIRSLETCFKQTRPVQKGRVDMVEVNYLAALAGTTWQEALAYVKGKFPRRVLS